MPHLKVIARHRNGRMVKGSTNNFSPSGGTFHMIPAGAGPEAAAVPVCLSELKAVFVVRDFRGNPGRPNSKSRLSESPSYSEPLEVTFQDGEVLRGFSLTYDPGAIGFFLFPADPASNNERIFVVNSAVREVRKL
jgi:hypothetical protein